MIYINGATDYWTSPNHEVVVCPCDCSGLMSRGAVRMLSHKLGERVAKHYADLCNNNHMTTGTTEYLFRGQGMTPVYVLYWPLAPNAASNLSFKAYVDCVEDLVEAVRHFGFTDVSVPYVWGLRGGWDEQETVLLDVLGSCKRECDFTLYNSVGADDLDEVEIGEEALVCLS